MESGGGSVRRTVIEADGIHQSKHEDRSDLTGAVLPSMYPIVSPIPSPTARRKKTADRVMDDIRVHGDVAYVTLTRGYVATIDAEDADKVAPFNWFAQVRDTAVYARSSKTVDGKRTAVFMHRLVLGLEDGEVAQGDHRDGDGLNNRKRNLRTANSRQQVMNRRMKAGASAYRGVRWNASRSRWVAKATIAGSRRYLGLFKSEAEASRAYEYVTKLVSGDFYRPPLAHEAAAPGDAPRLPPLVVSLLAELHPTTPALAQEA